MCPLSTIFENRGFKRTAVLSFFHCRHWQKERPCQDLNHACIEDSKSKMFTYITCIYTHLACSQKSCTDSMTFLAFASSVLCAYAALQQPTAPTLCTTANAGRCDCANLAPATSPVAKGQTYTWFMNGEQRCFTTYNTGIDGRGSRRETSLRPTVLFLQCYGGDRLTAVTRSALEAADRFGFALAYLSSPDHAWSWNTTVVNNTQPRPCDAASAGEDFTYVKSVLDFLGSEQQSGWFDASRVYTYGFSQNGMASAYVGRCFGDQITGSWIGGGGLFSPGHGPVPPNKAGTCSDGCQYWPVFPCHTASAQSTVAACIQFYSNDPVTVDQVSARCSSRGPAIATPLLSSCDFVWPSPSLAVPAALLSSSPPPLPPFLARAAPWPLPQHDPASGPRTKGHGLYLFDRLVSEGNDGRMLQFVPDEAVSSRSAPKAARRLGPADRNALLRSLSTT